MSDQGVSYLFGLVWSSLVHVKALNVLKIQVWTSFSMTIEFKYDQKLGSYVLEKWILMYLNRSSEFYPRCATGFRNWMVCLFFLLSLTHCD